MPRAFLKASGQEEFDESILANFAFLSRSDNRDIGGVAPSNYRRKMPGNLTTILESALTSETLFSDNFTAFINERADRLAKIAAELCGIDISKSAIT